jgi:hypothetical protein
VKNHALRIVQKAEIHLVDLLVRFSNDLLDSDQENLGIHARGLQLLLERGAPIQRLLQVRVFSRRKSRLQPLSNILQLPLAGITGRHDICQSNRIRQGID